MNGRGFRLSPIFFIKVQLASESWIFRENKKIESGGTGVRPPAFTLNSLRYNLRRSHANYRDFITFSSVVITAFSLMQHPVSLWDILPSRGRLTSDITSRTIFSALLQASNLSLTLPFIIFKFKVEFVTSSKHNA